MVGDVNCRDEHGRNSTPLHLAGVLYHLHFFIMWSAHACSFFAVSPFCFALPSFSFFLFPFFLYVAGYNHLDVAEYLLQNGADVNAKDKGGLVPLHNASSYGVCASGVTMYSSWLNYDQPQFFVTLTVCVWLKYNFFLNLFVECGSRIHKNSWLPIVFIVILTGSHRWTILYVHL